MPHKGLSRGGSFGKPTDKPDVLQSWLVRKSERLIEELDLHEVRTGEVTTRSKRTLPGPYLVLTLRITNLSPAEFPYEAQG
jgi:hypothetical protein